MYADKVLAVDCLTVCFPQIDLLIFQILKFCSHLFLQEKAGHESSMSFSHVARDSSLAVNCASVDDIKPIFEVNMREEAGTSSGPGVSISYELSRTPSPNPVIKEGTSSGPPIGITYVSSRTPSPIPLIKNVFTCEEQPPHKGKSFLAAMEGSKNDEVTEGMSGGDIILTGQSVLVKTEDIVDTDVVVKIEGKYGCIKTENLNMCPSDQTGFVMYPSEKTKWGSRQDPPMASKLSSQANSIVVKTENSDANDSQFSKPSPICGSRVLNLFSSGQVPSANIAKSAMGAGSLLIGQCPSSQIDLNAIDFNALLDNASKNSVIKDLASSSSCNDLGKVQQLACPVQVIAKISRAEGKLVARVMEDDSRHPDHVLVSVHKGLTAFNTDAREIFGGKPANCGIWDSTTKGFTFYMPTLAFLKWFIKQIYTIADRHGRSVQLDRSVEDIINSWVPESPRLSGWARVDLCSTRVGSDYLKMDGALDCLRSLVVTGDDEEASSYLVPGGTVLVNGYNSIHRVDGFKASELKAALKQFQLFDVRVCSENFDCLLGPPNAMLRRVE